MKIIDRYVITNFVRNYCISFMVLVGLYVALDMVFNFNNLVKFQSDASTISTVIDSLRDMADYYFYQCFLFFTQLSGIIPVVAAAFTLMRLSRFNELTALLAAGVPLLRIAAPIVLAALVLNALLLVDQELIIPHMIPKLVRDHDEIHEESSKGYYSVDFMQDEDDSLLRITKYYFRSPQKMDVVDVIQRKPIERTILDEFGHEQKVIGLEAYAHITADGAVWNDDTKSWDLTNGRRVTGLGVNETPSAPVPWPTYKSNVTPDEIALYRTGRFAELLSTERINQLLARPKSYGTLHLLRIKHLRFTQPLMNVILLLLAIPCVLQREPGRLKSAATKCLILMGIGMGSVFLTQQFANVPPGSIRPDQWTALMAWLPIFIFGPVSVYLLERVKS
ncbi:MAG TPA: LptF/LptG family permease [Humisphaera sp.]|nr:LptF/LptG family permease [Humisphaera sp.]